MRHNDPAIFLPAGSGRLCPHCNHAYDGLACPCFQTRADNERLQMSATRFLAGEIALPIYSDDDNITHIRKPVADPKVKRAWCGFQLTAKAAGFSGTRTVGCKSCMSEMRKAAGVEAAA